jgi:hypothetical protein
MATEYSPTGDDETDSAYEPTSSGGEYEQRENRFRGPDSTWRKYTAKERLAHTSLIKLRDRDLAIHLYNAHALKSRKNDPKIAGPLQPWAGKVSNFGGVCTTILT